MPDARISDHTRKRLWYYAGERCAFPGCEQQLLVATPDGGDDTIVGKECHIVAQRDSPRVARAPMLLSNAEREQYADLIEHRHSFRNLVLMCAVHSDVIDDVDQGYTVADVLEMKRAHEDTVSRERAEARAVRVEERVEPPTVRMVIVEDFPKWAHRAVRDLAHNEPDALQWLGDRVGEVGEPDDDRLRELIQGWPPELQDGSDRLLVTLARMAESRALWLDAADVLDRLADRYEGPQRADTLVRAAVDASVGGDESRHDRLLDQAEQLDPESPRLRLERLDDRADPQDQLDVLDSLYTDDPALMSLIVAHRARAAMQLPDLDLAERYLQEARAHDPDSLQVRAMSVNLRVQRARIALTEDRAFSLDEARSAMDDALALREDMIAMGRWEESGRLLMLAADVPALLRDPASAREVLKRAHPEEFASQDGAEVLGDAALRIGADDLALMYTGGADRSDAVRRIRATAMVDTPSTRVEGLRELRELALGGGDEATFSAFARLTACLPPVAAPWDEEVAAVLADSQHAQAGQSLRILAIAQSDVLHAEELASELPDDSAAAELRLRVAGVRGNHRLLAEAAEAFLRFSPDGSGRLLAGRALAKARLLERAEDVLRGVACDLNAPPQVRADAFHSLLSVLAERDDWTTARREWEAWADLTAKTLQRPDTRVSAWQVRVAHHAKRQPD